MMSSPNASVRIRLFVPVTSRLDVSGCICSLPLGILMTSYQINEVF